MSMGQWKSINRSLRDEETKLKFLEFAISEKEIHQDEEMMMNQRIPEITKGSDDRENAGGGTFVGLIFTSEEMKERSKLDGEIKELRWTGRNRYMESSPETAEIPAK